MGTLTKVIPAAGTIDFDMEFAKLAAKTETLHAQCEALHAMDYLWPAAARKGEVKVGIDVVRVIRKGNQRRTDEREYRTTITLTDTSGETRTYVVDRDIDPDGQTRRLLRDIVNGSL